MELFKIKDDLFKMMVYAKYFRSHEEDYAKVLQKPYSFGFFLYEPYLKCKSFIKKENYLEDYKLYYDRSTIFPSKFISFTSNFDFFKRAYSYIYLTKKSRKRVKFIINSIEHYFASRYNDIINRNICQNENEVKIINYLYDLIMNFKKYNSDYIFDYFLALSDEVGYKRASFLAKTFMKDFDIFIEEHLLDKIRNTFINQFYSESFIKDIQRINDKKELVKEISERE